MEKALPDIPAKRYFTIGEVSELCGVKPYVLRYWEQEFTQLRPMKRRGNRRYYQHHEVLLVRRIRELLYDQGFTISGARNRLSEGAVRAAAHTGEASGVAVRAVPVEAATLNDSGAAHAAPPQASERPDLSKLPERSQPTVLPEPLVVAAPLSVGDLRAELMSIRAMLLS
jgi:DNA-binding transcriptional MerR regulator